MPVHNSILVVDNEQLVREALIDILDTIGVHVISANSGREGIDTYQDYHNSIDLVILDMRLPGMDGPEILKALRAINPEVKVIVSSGYDEEEIERRFHDQSPTFILKKPYDAEKLLRVVQRVLAN